MENIAIGIIGGTGGIGKWFANFFTREGYTVHISGRAVGMRPDEMAAACHVVIVSVPISSTRDVIEQVGPYMQKNALLMDFTSLKGDPVSCMLESSLSEVMGCHPLFGPDVKSMERLNIVLCPVRVKKWAHWPKELFQKKGANVVETTPERHDEMMALVQGLNHFNTIMMGLTLKEAQKDMAELRKFSTPLFDTKLEIIEKIFNNPHLYSEIITANPSVRHIIDLYEKNLIDIKNLVETQDAIQLVDLLEKRS